MKRAILVFLVATSIIPAAFARDGGSVSVRGYYRSNGTYVAPHVRSAPDGIRSNNFGPSRGSGYSNPYLRDNDNDGVPNHRDSDDNNNGIYDDSDRNQYRLSE
jgi:hypothetical protein